MHSECTYALITASTCRAHYRWCARVTVLADVDPPPGVGGLLLASSGRAGGGLAEGWAKTKSDASAAGGCGLPLACVPRRAALNTPIGRAWFERASAAG